ncbi:MAG: SCO family protein [Flavobacteriales bacterium]
MNKWKKYIALCGMLFLFPLFFLLFFGKGATHHFSRLRYLDPAHDTLVAESNYKLPSFAFTNQHGDLITNETLKDKVWIAAFYSLGDEHLAKITDRLLNINFKYGSEDDICIVVFSTDCDHDTQETMAAYTTQLTRYQAHTGKWQFLTGNQQAMQSFIRNGFLANDLSNEAIFRLVDTEGHIRGLYGNTEYHIQDAIEDIALLKKEIDLKKYHARKASETNN